MRERKESLHGTSLFGPYLPLYSVWVGRQDALICSPTQVPRETWRGRASYQLSPSKLKNFASCTLLPVNILSVTSRRDSTLSVFSKRDILLAW